MTTLTFNGKKVNEIINSYSSIYFGHNVTLLLNGFVVKGNSKDDCIDTLHRLFPETKYMFKPSIEWFY